MSDNKTYYLVDYENVGVEGLKGISGLPAKAQTHIFSTCHAEKISTKVLSAFNGKDVWVHEVAAGDQSADKHLVSYLGFLIGQHGSASGYVITSKDAGFDNVLQFCKKEMGVSVTRQECLANVQKSVKASEKKETPANTNSGQTTNVSPEKKKEHQIRCFFGSHFKEKKYQDNKEVIINAVLASKSKTQVNTRLTQAFPGDEVKMIYGRLKPFIEEWPGQ